MATTPNGRRAFQNRATAGGGAASAHSDPGAIALPLWVKVGRKGGTFTGYYSKDGKSWTISPPDGVTTPLSNSSNPQQITMDSDVYVGLAVTSHNVAVPAVARFSDVSTPGAVSGQWQVKAIGAEQPANDPAPLYVALEDSAGHVGTVTHTDPGAVLTTDWQQWAIPLTAFGPVNPASVSKMSIGVGSPNSATPGGAGRIYIDDIGFGHPLSSE